MTKLSVVIPAYNEAKRIKETLLDVQAYLSKQAYSYEVLVVNDGSKDETASVVTEIQKSFPALKLIDNPENHGKGWVTKQGMLKAEGEIRVFMDADNSTKISEIAQFLPYFEQGYDVVLGSRRIEGSNVAQDQDLFRAFQGWVFRIIVHTLVPVGVIDTQCGFKAFSKKATEVIFPKQTIYRWAFDVEILALARKNRFQIKELPITWVNDADSHVKLSGKIKMLLEVVQIRLNLWFGKYK